MRLALAVALAVAFAAFVPAFAARSAAYLGAGEEEVVLSMVHGQARAEHLRASHARSSTGLGHLVSGRRRQRGVFSSSSASSR